MAERGGQGGQELLEAQALGERELHPPAVQDAREGLAEEAEPLHQVVRPGVAVTNGGEGEHAEDGSPGAQGDQDLRVRAHALEAVPIDRGRLGKLGESRESDDLPLPQSPRHPGELVVGRDPRRLLEARPRPREAEPRPAVHVLVETASIHAQELDDVLERALDRHLGVGSADVNQPGGQRREERLEAQAVRQHELRRPARRPASQVAQSHLSPPRPPGCSLYLFGLPAPGVDVGLALRTGCGPRLTVPAQAMMVSLDSSASSRIRRATW